MKLVYPDFHSVLETECGAVPSLVIEAPSLLYAFLTDLAGQAEGLEGRAVLSAEERVLDISKHLEILDRFVPFELNRKSLLTKVVSSLEKIALNEENYLRSQEILANIEKFANDLAFSEECDIICTKVTIPNLLRAIGIELRDQYDSLGEKIVDYMELVRAYDRDKLFVTVNLRSFLSDRDAEELCKTVLSHGFHLLMLESHAYERLSCEARTVIDADLCEF